MASAKALGKVITATKIYFDSSYFSDSLVGSGLPDQTGNNGKFLSTDGTDASWTALAGGGDMLIATYDPTSVAGDAFDMDNMVDGTYVKTENNLTDALVSTIGSALQSETSHADVLVDGDIGVTVQELLVSGTNIKTINSTSLLGSGDIVVSGSMPRGHIWGLTMSNAADTANDITIAAGEARDEAGTEDLVLASAITKQIDAGWAVGTNQGGINTGSVADSTWYEVILIKRTDTGVVDVMFSTTANRATLPASYDKYRRIGWVRRGSATLLQFTQVEDYFTWTTQINDIAANHSTNAAAGTLTVPPNTIARFRAATVGTTSVNANSAVVFSEIVEGDVTPAITTGIASLGYGDIATAPTAGHFELRVSSTSTIEYDSSVAVSSFDISTFGYIDRRCRLQNI